jgi:diguanylate cyclase (GGDEF)-like protein/PAS domain S-box-containing protein
MEVGFTDQESSALYRLLTENSRDMVLKTDRDGLIRYASASCAQLGIAFPGPLVGSYIADLVDSGYVAAIRKEHDAAVHGLPHGKGIEFPTSPLHGAERWFELRMRSLTDDHGRVYGALSIIRSIEERRKLEDQLFEAAMTDPLTGLTNRRAFISMLQYLVDKQVTGCLAIFNIDHFRAINIQHGLAFGDEALVAFANQLRSLMRSDDIISRIGGESLGVLLPQANTEQAMAICRRVITHLAGLRLPVGGKSISFTASAGLAQLGQTLDSTIASAELALFLAKAKGRNRVEIGENHHTNWARPGAYEKPLGDQRFPQLDNPAA